MLSKHAIEIYIFNVVVLPFFYVHESVQRKSIFQKGFSYIPAWLLNLKYGYLFSATSVFLPFLFCNLV